MLTTGVQYPPKAIRQKPLLPYKIEDRLQLPTSVRIPSKYDNFIELLVMCDYKVEYSNGDIVSILETNRENSNIIMGNASLTHEQLVGNIMFLLNLIYFRQQQVHIYSSNSSIFHTDGYPTYNPDVTLVKGIPQTQSYKFRKKTQEVLLNPSLVVEVLSQGTREYDLVEKFANYRKIESMQQIIFVEQYWCEVSSYTRQIDGSWSYMNLESLENQLLVESHKILLSDIYNKVEFEKR